MSSSYSKENVLPNMISVKDLGRDEKASYIGDVKMDRLQSAPRQKLSVVDMLFNDEPTCCINQSSEREAHVAFSIQETPVRSQEAPSRTFFQSSSPPLKAARSLHSFPDINSELVNFEFDSDAMMQCTDAFLDRSFKKSSYPRDKVDSTKPYNKSLTFDEFSLFNNHDKNISELLGGDKFCDRTTQRNKNIWDASAEPSGDKLAEKGFHFSDNIWMDEMDASDDFLYSTQCRTDDLTFEGYEWQKNRPAMTKACKVEPTESPVPDFKYKSETSQKLRFSDMTWNSGIARSHDDGDLQYKPGSCFIDKEARETESLLSEESCSSTAVSGVNKPKTMNSEGRRTTMRCGMNYPISISSEKMSANLRNSTNSLQEENMNGHEEVTIISTPLSSESVLCLKTASAREKQDKASLFGIEYEPVETTRGFEFDSKSSGAVKHVSSSCKLWLDDDMFDGSGDIKFSERSSFERLGMRKSPSPQKTDTRQRSGKLFRAQDVLVSEDESTGGDGYEKPDTFMIDSVETNIPQREILSRAKSSSSEDGNSTAALESVLKHSNYEEAPKGSPKTRTNLGEICRPEGMETFARLDGKHQVLKKFQLDQTSPLSQAGFGGIEDSGPGQRTRRNEGKCTSSSPCQMIAVSYNFFAFRF